MANTNALLEQLIDDGEIDPLEFVKQLRKENSRLRGALREAKGHIIDELEAHGDSDLLNIAVKTINRALRTK